MLNVVLFSVNLFVLFQILRTFECFPTGFAFVRLQRYVYSDMRSDVITLDVSDAACLPVARKAEVICRLSTDMVVCQVKVEVVWVVEFL